MKQEKLNYSDLTPLPNNFLAEQAILNILITNPGSFSTIQKLRPEAFYSEQHKIIYEVIIELHNNQINITLTNIIGSLSDKALLKKIGGIERLINIINSFENFFNLEQYVLQVNEKYLRRLIIQLGKQSVVWGFTTSEKIENILSRLEKSLLDLNQDNLSQKVYTAAEVIEDIYSEMKTKIETNTQTGYRTMFHDLDSIVQGFQKSDLIIIAGRPSMGKTAFALSVAKNIIVKYKIPLLIFTLEMSRQQIIYRFLSSTSQINANRLKSGRMNLEEWKQLSIAMRELADLPLFIDDNPNLTVTDIRLKLKKIINQKKKEGLIIIDYLQLMKMNSNVENRVQEISSITRNLKILAKEFEIPILLLSQLSRNVESRINKRPMLSDLRESGCIISENLCNKSQVISWGTKNLNIQKFSKFDIKGLKPIFLVNFENKVRVSLSSNHKILSRLGWISVSQIYSQIEFYSIKNKHHNLEKCYYNYKKIKNIKYKGINFVFDKTIPKYHNYIKKNLVLHNSIEQDADIVMMLYRDDYYNQQKELTPLTEILIVKHRNGPTGTARLIFNSLTTSFSNLSTNAKNQI